MLKRKGFTLIELLVVILIIGILLALIIPNFALFQERARRSSVKNNMHVVQTALEAWATDHAGNYPNADVAWDTPEEGIGPYFPGGDIYGIGGEVKPGNFPTNPYTTKRYNMGDYTDLNYEDFYGEFEPGQNAQIRGDDDNCPYLDWEGVPEVAGSIFIGTYINEATEVAEEYGMAGWGRDATFVPMYELDPEADDPMSEEYWIFFVLHN